MQALEMPKGDIVHADGDMGLLSVESVLSSLLDAPSRKIVMSIMEGGKTVDGIKEATGIPLSTCYRKVAALVKSNIIVVERMVMTPAGKKHSVYRCAIAGIRVEVANGAMSVTVLPNHEMTGRQQMARLSKQFER